MHGNSYLRGVLYEEDVVLKRKAVETHESYPVRILDWNVDYSLRLDKDGSLSGGPFLEHCSPELTGEFVGPKKLEGREVRITLGSSRRRTSFYHFLDPSDSQRSAKANQSLRCSF